MSMGKYKSSAKSYVGRPLGPMATDLSFPSTLWKTNTDKHYEAGGHYAKGNKPVIEGQILHDSTHMKYLK